MMAKNPSSPPINLRTAVAGKPDLVVHGADLTVTARALAKLLAEKCDYLFVHGGEPVIVELGENDAPPTMRPAGVNEIVIAAHKFCQPVKRKSAGERIEITLPDKVAELYFGMPEEWRLRPLRGITMAPILHDDGSIRWEPGYDADTRLFSACNLPALSVPDKPSHRDALRALKTLRHTFRTFAFADREIVTEKMNVDGEAIDVEVVDLTQPPGKDESGFLHALLTSVARPSLPLAPGVVARAPQHSGSGTGKGKLGHAMSIIAHGRKAKAAVLGERKEEFDKGLTAELLVGRPFVFIDNLNNTTLRSRLLCAVLGESDADLRKLGSGMESVSPAFIYTTGNALAIAEDLVRRIVLFELDAGCEDPEQRKFAGDFLTDIKNRQAELLQAVLTIWRWGRLAGIKSKSSAPLGGFERWTAWVRDPLVALGCQDPVTRIANLKASDPDRLLVVEIFRIWWKYHRDDYVKGNDLCDAVKALLVPDRKKRTRQAVASRLRKLGGTRLAGFHLTSNKDDENKGKWSGITYRLIRLNAGEGAQPGAGGTNTEWENVAETEAVQEGWHNKDQFEGEDEERFESGDFPLDDEASASASAPEAAGGFEGDPDDPDDPDDRDGYHFNREPAAGRSEPAAPASPAVPVAPTTAPPDALSVDERVALWRKAFASLNPQMDPCPGYRADEWPRAHACSKQFLAGPHSLTAVRAGWSAVDLFGVHRPLV
jgi:hypothetical protein